MSRAAASATSAGSTGGSPTVMGAGLPGSCRRPRPDGRPMAGRRSRSPDDVQVGEAREHGLATDRRVLEGDRDLLVAPGQLRGHDDAVAPPAVAHPVAVSELSLARDD